MAVIIFNPNERKDPRSDKEIPQFLTMEKHCLYVWENVVEGFSKAKEIYFVSHSMGGYCTVDIIAAYRKVFLTQLRLSKIKLKRSLLLIRFMERGLESWIRRL